MALGVEARARFAVEFDSELQHFLAHKRQSFDPFLFSLERETPDEKMERKERE